MGAIVFMSFVALFPQTQAASAGLAMAADAPTGGFRQVIAASGVKLFWLPDGSRTRLTGGFQCHSSDYGVQGPDTWPAISPTEALVAFSRRVEPECFSNRHIFTVDADGIVSQLTTSPGLNEYPAWSGDGSQVAYTRSLEGDSDIWVISRDGLGDSPMIQGVGDQTDPTWDRTTGHVAFASEQEGRFEIRDWDPSSASSTLIIRGAMDFRHPAWSPDGQHIAVVATPRHDRGVGAEAYVLDIASGELVRVSDERWDVHDVAWAPTSQQLAVGTCGTDQCSIATWALSTGRRRAIGPGGTPDWGAWPTP